MESSSYHHGSSSGLPPRPVPINISSDSSDEGYDYIAPMPRPFRPNQRVEVIGAEVGMLGSLYEATVLRRLDPSHYEVEYITLTDDNNEPLTEIVQAGRLLPQPPRVRFRLVYTIDDRVDCRALDGFWTSRVVGQGQWLGNIPTHSVHFPMTGDTHDYRAREMRPHFEWNGTRWTTQPHFRYLLR